MLPADHNTAGDAVVQAASVRVLDHRRENTSRQQAAQECAPQTEALAWLVNTRDAHAEGCLTWGAAEKPRGEGAQNHENDDAPRRGEGTPSRQWAKAEAFHLFWGVTEEGKQQAGDAEADAPVDDDAAAATKHRGDGTGTALREAQGLARVGVRAGWIRVLPWDLRPIQPAALLVHAHSLMARLISLSTGCEPGRGRFDTIGC